MSFSLHIFSLKFAKKFGKIFSRKSLQCFWQNNFAKSKIRGKYVRKRYSKTCRLPKSREKVRERGCDCARFSFTPATVYNGFARLFMRSYNDSYVRHTAWNWNSGNWSRANNCCVLIGRRPSGKVVWKRNLGAIFVGDVLYLSAWVERFRPSVGIFSKSPSRLLHGNIN